MSCERYLSVKPSPALGINRKLPLQIENYSCSFSVKNWHINDFLLGFVMLYPASGNYLLSNEADLLLRMSNEVHYGPKFDVTVTDNGFSLFVSGFYSVRCCSDIGSTAAPSQPGCCFTRGDFIFYLGLFFIPKSEDVPRYYLKGMSDNTNNGLSYVYTSRFPCLKVGFFTGPHCEFLY